ncbi:MAG: hypothetical protein ABI835_11870 [Chloroflexota bacterium]
MKRSLLLLVICFTCFALSGVLQAQSDTALTVTCDDNGATFDNGVEIIISQVRSGFTYTATAIGLDGFDPVLAVLTTETGSGLCSDDAEVDSDFAVDLPTTGSVSADNLSAQVTFSQDTGENFADISLVVGGFNNQTGEFVLVLEGMGATNADNGGDLYKVNITSNMVNSGLPLNVYMVATTTSLDPYIFMPDDDFNVFANSQGVTFDCDDAGSSLCYGDSPSLEDSSVTGVSGRVPGGQYDAVFSLPLELVSLSDDRTENYYYFVMTSSPQAQSEGEYILVFHMGLSSTDQTDGKGSDSNGSGSLTGGAESGS